MKEKKPFQNLKYQIHGVPESEDLINKFPGLANIPAFSAYGGSLDGKANRNKVIRYIIYMYDMKSDLIDQFHDLQKRKEAAAQLAGFKRKESTGEFEKGVKAIMDLTDKSVYDLIFAFLVDQNNIIWAMRQSHEQSVYENVKLIMRPISDDSDEKEKDTLSAATLKDKLSDMSDKFIAKIQVYDKQLFGDNEDIKEMVKIERITPETIFKHVNSK